MNVRVVDHPVAASHLRALRHRDTSRDEFRQHLDALTSVLLTEALADASTVTEPVPTPLDTAAGRRLMPMPAVVPVLRAGLGMLDAALRLLPEAPVGFVGLKRVESDDGVSHVGYLESLPNELGGRPVLLLDPMLATGGSVAEALRVLAEAGVGPVTIVCALAAPEGIVALGGDAAGRPVPASASPAQTQPSDALSSSTQPPQTQLVTASIDSHLNERAFIVPGLGDAGDRLYGTA